MIIVRKLEQQYLKLYSIEKFTKTFRLYDSDYDDVSRITELISAQMLQKE